LIYTFVNTTTILLRTFNSEKTLGMFLKFVMQLQNVLCFKETSAMKLIMFLVKLFT